MMPIQMRIHGLVAGLLLFSSLVIAATEGPQDMVRATADKVLAAITERKAELDADPKLIYPLVESTVLPNFDFREMAKSALGRHWRSASEAQRDAVTSEFRELLVRTYATALLGYTGQTIEYLPVQYRPGDTRVMIPTRIASGGAPPIPINYRLKLGESEKWMVYDVVVDGVSLVTTYRSQFASQVSRGGIDALISALAKKNR